MDVITGVQKTPTEAEGSLLALNSQGVITDIDEPSTQEVDPETVPRAAGSGEW